MKFETQLHFLIFWDFEFLYFQDPDSLPPYNTRETWQKGVIYF